jgi:hypothetical protein
MYLFVSTDGDSIGAAVGRMSLADDIVGIRQISHKIEQGNEAVKSWAISNGGTVISMGGDEARIQIPVDKIDDIEEIRKRYFDTVGATLSVGVGLQMSEADKALAIAKLHGKNRAVFWHNDYQSELDVLHRQTEDEKLSEEYFSKSDPYFAILGELEKGVANRLHPFSPGGVLGEAERSDMSRWTGGGHPALRERLPKMEGSARFRALHRLTAKTSTRRNATTGEREFLLHRGMSAEEHAKASSVHGEGFLGSDTRSSWTPKKGIASSFGDRDHLVSAWVPESSIVTVPSQFGHLRRGKQGSHVYGDEHEVVVDAGHKSQVATEKESEDPSTNSWVPRDAPVNQKINIRASLAKAEGEGEEQPPEDGPTTKTEEDNVLPPELQAKIDNVVDGIEKNKDALQKLKTNNPNLFQLFKDSFDAMYGVLNATVFDQSEEESQEQGSRAGQGPGDEDDAPVGTFKNGKIKIRHPDGSTAWVYPPGTMRSGKVKIRTPDGGEKWVHSTKVGIQEG